LTAFAMVSTRRSSVASSATKPRAPDSVGSQYFSAGYVGQFRKKERAGRLR
jgi:hypothetical protein